MTALLSVALGSIVGLSLGLTGAGGAILALPLLVYGLGMAPVEAVKTLNKKGDKEYIPTVSMPKEALLALLQDDQVREDLVKAVKSLEA